MATEVPAAGREQSAEKPNRPHLHLLTGSTTLVVTAAVQALGGAVFWLVAARIDTTVDVGRATALFTSTLFIAYLASLGLPVALARYAPGRDHESHVTFTWAALLTGGAAVVAAGLYLLAVDTEATRSLTSFHPVLGPAGFALLGAGAATSLVVDVRWMTMRRWNLVLIRTTAVGVGRFVLLMVPSGGHETIHLFAAAMVPLWLSSAIGLATMGRVTGDGHRLFPLPRARATIARYSVVNYVSTLAYQAPQFVLPVIVLLSVDPDTNAAFYVAWGVTSIALYVPTAIGQALLAEGGKDGAVLASQVRVVLGATAALMATAALVTAVGRGVVTTVYGQDYSEAARILPLLVAAAVPWAVVSVFLTEARVLHRHLATLAITVTLTATILLPAAVLVPRDGVDGATTAFLAGNLAAAAVATGFHLAGRTRVPTVLPATVPVEDDLHLHP